MINRFGIQDLADDDVIALSPARIDHRSLRIMSNPALLRLRNILLIEQGYYQSYAHAGRLNGRLACAEAEMDRRGLAQWLETPCAACGQRVRNLREIGGDLMGECGCSAAMRLVEVS